jgi:DNA-binding CsgD family transcriptional regulator
MTKKIQAALNRHLDTFLADHNVTPREREVLALMAGGVCTSEDIAAALDRSVNTVNNHIKSLLRATRYSSKTAIVAALARHIIEAETVHVRRAA